LLQQPKQHCCFRQSSVENDNGAPGPALSSSTLVMKIQTEKMKKFNVRSLFLLWAALKLLPSGAQDTLFNYSFFFKL
jgi:hypothetical protein